MAKNARKRPSKGTEAPKTATESPKSPEADRGQPVATQAGVSFRHGDAVELNVAADVAAACFTLATGAKCPDSVVAISLTPPREGRASTLSLRFVTPASAGDFVESFKGD